ncbi:isoprenylcysteine carboxylmethyltransferase family protein [Streptomyces sp. LS1784]|uniref:methyltransferase family protein n=1 Tax=Streptomyces sp. LS1784 TaxID=2851533 RepID=UPI001CC9E6D1|nr:isoprenylcysteine carboxylmethyltransferase family protein [Streptomyces sp. LS1784]
MSGWAWTALILFVGWAGYAFGVRAAVQHHQTGDAGFRGISGRPGSASWWAGVLFVLAMTGGAAAPVAALAGLGNLPATGGAAVRWAGLAVTLVGIAATTAAQGAMGASWRVGVQDGEHTALVTSGAFALVRNPVFTAMSVTAAGLALMVPNAVAVLTVAALVAAIQLQVRVVEEPYLARTHAGAYAAYTATAGRFVPDVGRRRA